MQNLMCGLAHAVRAKLTRQDSPGHAALADDKWRLLVALEQREKEKRPTALRDVHVLLDVTQPKAFRVVRSLEFDRLLLVETNLHDAMAAAVRLSEQGHALMTEARKAA